MAEEKWERCRICGIEWPDNALAECPQYRNSDHRKCRTNVRSQDVMSFVKGVAVAPAPDVELSDMTAIVDATAVAGQWVEADPVEGAIGDKLWPMRSKKKKSDPDASA